MSRKVFAALFLYYMAASIGHAAEPSDAPETWTYWVSGGKKGIGPRVYRDDEFAIGVSEGFVNERAVGFKENGGIIFLRSGKDIENPEFADPEMEEIGAVHDHKLWKAEYYRGEEAHKNVKAILLLIADDDDQLHPFSSLRRRKTRNCRWQSNQTPSRRNQSGWSQRLRKERPTGLCLRFPRAFRGLWETINDECKHEFETRSLRPLARR